MKVGVFFGGMSIQKDEETLKNVNPHIVVGTPGRILALIRNKKLNLKHLKHFILDECDKMLEQLGGLPKVTVFVLIIKYYIFQSSTDMRRDVQEIFRSTPHGKQVMMFSATLSKDIRPVCKKFMQDVNISDLINKTILLLLLLLPLAIRFMRLKLNPEQNLYKNEYLNAATNINCLRNHKRIKIPKIS